VAHEPYTPTPGACRWLDDYWITNAACRSWRTHTLRKDSRRRVADARAREPTRKTALVSRYPYGGGTGPEQRLSATLDSGRKPLETAICLRRDEPHGV
jgi:hypothetical protein